MLWRNQPGGYLKEILTARVYDVAVRDPGFISCTLFIQLLVLAACHLQY